MRCKCYPNLFHRLLKNLANDETVVIQYASEGGAVGRTKNHTAVQVMSQLHNTDFYSS